MGRWHDVHMHHCGITSLPITTLPSTMATTRGGLYWAQHMTSWTSTDRGFVSRSTRQGRGTVAHNLSTSSNMWHIAASIYDTTLSMIIHTSTTAHLTSAHPKNWPWLPPPVLDRYQPQDRGSRESNTEVVGQSTLRRQLYSELYLAKCLREDRGEDPQRKKHKVPDARCAAHNCLRHK